MFCNDEMLFCNDKSQLASTIGSKKIHFVENMTKHIVARITVFSVIILLLVAGIVATGG